MDASVSFVRRQQGEQTEAGVGVGSVQTSQFTKHASWRCFRSEDFLLLTRTRTRDIFFISMLAHDSINNTFGLSVSPSL